MPGKPDDDEDDTLELTNKLDDQDTGKGPDDEDDAGDDAGAADDPDGEGEGEEETVIGFADELEAEGDDRPDDNATIRAMRAQLKESKKRIAELEKAAPAATKIERRPKPTLAGNNYDEDAFEADLDAWKAEEEAAERAETEAAEQSRAVNEAWQADLKTYAEKQANLGVEDFEEAEETIKATLSLVQQAVIVKAAADPAALVYALSRSPAKLAELAKQNDPIKLAAAIARMEGAVKVVKKRKGPAIDKPQGGSGKTPVSGDKAKQLEKLEKDAERSGDRTALIKFKKANKL